MPRLLPLLALVLGVATTGRATAQAPPPAPATPAGLHFVYLVRHGMYDRAEGVDDRLANGLNPLGREQAAILGARLRVLPVRLDTLVSSDYSRARETAAAMARELGRAFGQDSLLREGLAPAERAEAMRGASPEELAGTARRFDAAYAKWATPSPDRDRHTVMVAHGNLIRWWVAKALGVDPRQWTRMDAANCGLTVIAIRPDGSARLAMFNDVGHLRLEKQTWTGRGAGWR
jgi:serine/threonine-protein phosphatase PGAM5